MGLAGRSSARPRRPTPSIIACQHKAGSSSPGDNMSEGHTPLLGKRILVTGGTTGIGRATVALLAGEGARILTFGRDAAALEDCLGSLGESRRGVAGMTADV